MNKNLIRYPEHMQDKNLFAWSSADVLLIEYVLNLEQLESKKILIINDHFGAISTNLKYFNIDSYTDSFISFKSICINSKQSVNVISDLNELAGRYDLVLVNLPKNHSFFEDILCKLSSILDQGTPFVFCGMVKHISKGHFELIENKIGKLTTSLAVKKARLIFSKLEKNSLKSPFPKDLNIPGFEIPFTQHSNIFSREKLDIGTRFFLENIPILKSGDVLDLGCANGIVGIKAKRMNPNIKMYFCDESKMAIKSTIENFNKYFPNESENIYWIHNMEFLPHLQFDLILCNPPFHQGTTVGIHIANEMFKSSYKRLKKYGRLRIIANSHLGYHQTLKKIFGNCQLINSNKKFVILECIKN